MVAPTTEALLAGLVAEGIGGRIAGCRLLDDMVLHSGTSPPPLKVCKVFKTKNISSYFGLTLNVGIKENARLRSRAFFYFS